MIVRQLLLQLLILNHAYFTHIPQNGLYINLSLLVNIINLLFHILLVIILIKN